MEQKIESLDDAFKGIDVDTMDLEELCEKFTDESKGLKCSFYEDYFYSLSFDIQSRFISNIEKIKDINPEYIVAILDYFWVKEIVDILGEEKLYWLSNVYDGVKGSEAFKKRLEDDMHLMAESDVNDDEYRCYLYYMADTYYSFSEIYITSYKVLLSKIKEFISFVAEFDIVDFYFIDEILREFKEEAGDELWSKFLDKNPQLLKDYLDGFFDEDLLTV